MRGTVVRMPGKSENFVNRVADAVQGNRPKKRWQTAFLMFGSALLGASAVALWNRRVVAELQSQAPAREAGSSSGVQRVDGRMEEEIF